jgi:hypothetical protein
MAGCLDTDISWDNPHQLDSAGRFPQSSTIRGKAKAMKTLQYWAVLYSTTNQSGRGLDWLKLENSPPHPSFIVQAMDSLEKT